MSSPSNLTDEVVKWVPTCTQSLCAIVKDDLSLVLPRDNKNVIFTAAPRY